MKTKQKADQSRKTSGTAQRQAEKSKKQAQVLRDRRVAAQKQIDKVDSAQTKGKRVTDAQRQELKKQRVAAQQELRSLDEPLEAAEKQEKLDRRRALDAANTALADERAANTAAVKAGQRKPFALADQVVDVFDAGSLSRADQVKLLGGQSPVTMEEAARADAKRVKAAARQKALTGAQALEAQIRHQQDKKYRETLLKETQGELYQIGQSMYEPSMVDKAEDVKETAKSLARTTEELDASQRRKLLDGVASGVEFKEYSDRKDPVAEGIKDSIKEGHGAFGVEFSAALHRQGQPEGSQALMSTTLTATREIREEFEEKAQKTDTLNAELANMMGSFGETMSPQEQQNAINAFKKAHAKEYAELEAAAKPLEGALEVSSSALQYDKEDLPGHTADHLREEADKVIQQAPAFSETEHGKKMLQQEVERQAQDKPSFLDNFEAVTSKVKDGNDVLTKMSGAVAKATAQAGVTAKSQGKDALANSIFDTLEKNHAFFGVTQGDMKNLATDFKTLMDADPKNTAEWTKARDSLEAHLTKISGDVPGAAGNELGVKALRGLGAFTSLVGAAKNVQDIIKGDATSETYLKAVGDSVNGAGDGILTLAEMFGKATDSGVFKALGTVSAVGGLVSATGDLIAASEAWKDGDVFKGLSKSASAAGGAILASSVIAAGLGVQGVPVAGQIVGGTLVALGAAGSLYDNYRQAQAREEDVKTFLEAGGYSELAAEELSQLDGDKNVGQFLQGLSDVTGIKPEALRLELNKLNQEQLQAVVTASKETPTDKRGRYQVTDETPYELHDSTSDKVYDAYPPDSRIHSMTDAIAYLRSYDVRI